MLLIKKESAWKFVTSSTGGIGVEFVAVSGGTLYFTDPGGKSESIYYGGIGVGLSAGFKLPKLKVKSNAASAVMAPSSFPNGGKLYIMDSFKGAELSRSDLTGPCIFAEIQGGLIVGGSGTAMLLGLNPGLAAAFTTMAGPVLFPMLVNSAKAVFLVAGVNAGIQAGAGVAGYMGYLF